MESFVHTFNAVNDTAGWEIRCFHVLHELVNGDVVVVDVGDSTVYHFAEVVRRHIGGHTDRNAGGAVDQQIRNLRRQNGGFVQTLVKVGAKINRLFVEVIEHFLSDFAEAGLRVTHRCGVVAVNGAKVSLAVDHGVAQRPVLGHADHGVVHRAVAVRVVFTQHLPYNSCALLVCSVRKHAQIEHAVEHASVNGLQPVPYIR